MLACAADEMTRESAAFLFFVTSGVYLNIFSLVFGVSVRVYVSL